MSNNAVIDGVVNKMIGIDAIEQKKVLLDELRKFHRRAVDGRDIQVVHYVELATGGATGGATRRLIRAEIQNWLADQLAAKIKAYGG
jgi:hypothetical protein